MKNQLLSISLFISTLLSAQQFSMPSQLKNNLVLINPAYTGSFGTTVASIMHRQNWVGLNGGLSFQNFEMHSPMKKQSVALGLQAKQEQLGATKNTEVFFNYGHRIRIKDARLAFGLKGGVQSKSMEEIYLENPNDVAFESVKSQLSPNFGFGISFCAENYFLGVSVPYLLNTIAGTDGNVSIEYDMQKYSYVLSGGLKYEVSPDIELQTTGTFVYSLLLKPTYTLILNASYKNMLVVGGGYRAKEGIIINAGYNLNRQISFMYSYDYNIGDVGYFSKGSHEIGLFLYWGYKVNTINPRDF